MSQKKNVHKRLTIATLIILCFLTIGCNPRVLPYIRDQVANIDEKATKQAEEKVKESPVLQKLDGVCNDLPFLKDLRLIGRRISTRKSNFLAYSYETKINLDDMLAVDKKFLLESGWTLLSDEKWYFDHTMKYNKDNYLMIITYGLSSDPSIYVVTCEDLESLK
jgi:hypothetical protein